MINVKVSDRLITVSGHAGFDDYGRDIVCASVSSIIATTVNGILNIDDSAIKYNDDGKLLKIEMMKDVEVVGILIDNMIALLEELEIKYPKNMKIVKEI